MSRSRERGKRQGEKGQRQGRHHRQGRYHKDRFPGILQDQIEAMGFKLEEKPPKQGPAETAPVETEFSAMPQSKKSPSETTEVRIGEEERREVEASLSECGREHALTALSRGEFFGSAQPSGCAFVPSSSYFCFSGTWVKELCLVVFRRADRGEAEIYRYPKSIQDMVADGDAERVIKTLAAENRKTERTAKAPAPRAGVKEPEKRPAPPTPLPQKEEGNEDAGHLTQLGVRFVFIRNSLGTQADWTKEETLGRFLDEVRNSVVTHAENSVGLWDKILRADPESEARALLQERADKLAREFVNFLEGARELEGLELTTQQKELAKRVAAMYYAGALWSAEDISERTDENLFVREKERALWLLFKTGALKIAHSEPQGGRNMRVSREMWLEFPHVLLGAASSDSRAAEASGLLADDTMGRIAEHALASAKKHRTSRDNAQKESTLSPIEALKNPREGRLVLPVRLVYLERSNVCYPGGFFLLSVVRSLGTGYSLRVLEVVDESFLVALHEASMRRGTRVGTRIVSLSENIRSLFPEEARLRDGTMDIPFAMFAEEKLQSRDVERSDFPRAIADDRELYEAVRKLTSIIRNSFTDAFAKARKAEAQQNAPGQGRGDEMPQVAPEPVPEKEPGAPVSSEDERETPPGNGHGEMAEESSPQTVSLPPVAPLSGTLGPREASFRNTWASPKAEALARELGIADEEIRPSGKNGTVTKADVEAHSRAGAAE